MEKMLKRPAGRPKIDRVHLEKSYELLRTGHTVASAAKKTSVTVATFYRYLRERHPRELQKFHYKDLFAS